MPMESPAAQSTTDRSPLHDPDQVQGAAADAGPRSLEGDRSFTESSNTATDNEVKPEVTHHVSSTHTHEHDDRDNQAAAGENVPWRPSFWRVAPLTGIVALAFVVLQVIASYAVLKFSDGDDIATWTYAQPHPNIIARANNTALTNHSMQIYHLIQDPPTTIRTTLAGVVWAAYIQYDVFETLYPLGRGQMQEVTPRKVPWTTFSYSHTLVDGGPSHCIPSFSDPRDEVMAGLNDLLFRAAAHYPQF